MNRKKVINGLEVSIISDTDKGYKTIEIPVDEAENILALLKEQEESIPLKPLCKWLAGYAAPPGNTSWLPMFGSLEKAWEHELKELFTS